MERGCTQTECTVAATGVCLLNNDPTTCPHRIAHEVDDDQINVAAEVASVLERPTEKAKFPPSRSLSPAEANLLMSEHYCRVVGILGAPDAGKTALLVSLYLLLGRNRLDGFEFADSRTIMAFEEISRGARRWNEGLPPDQMTSHTESPDARVPGFVHLRVRRVSSGESIDMLFPDLPGEWTTSLIDSNRVDRLDFLKSADTIWLMLDGRELIQSRKRQYALHRAKLLMQRLATFLEPRIPPVMLVISHRDSGVPSADTLRGLAQEAARFSIFMKIIQIASFSDSEGTPPGAGIVDLISSTIKDLSEPLPFWPDSQTRTAARAMLNFRVPGKSP